MKDSKIWLRVTDNMADGNHHLCRSEIISSRFELEVIPSSRIVYRVHISRVHMFALHSQSFLVRTLAISQTIDIATDILDVHNPV
jgi:hypothetical protein